MYYLRSPYRTVYNHKKRHPEDREQNLKVLRQDLIENSNSTQKEALEEDELEEYFEEVDELEDSESVTNKDWIKSIVADDNRTVTWNKKNSIKGAVDELEYISSAETDVTDYQQLANDESPGSRCVSHLQDGSDDRDPPFSSQDFWPDSVVVKEDFQSPVPIPETVEIDDEHLGQLDENAVYISRLETEIEKLKKKLEQKDTIIQTYLRFASE